MAEAVTIDPARAVQWLRRAIQTPSVTGTEAAFAGLVGTELDQVGVDEVQVADVASGRPIVWSVTRGTGAVPPVMLAGHLDTVRVEGWSEHWRGTEREDPFGAVVADGAVWGRGASDVKGGIATVMEALRAINATGQRPAGDVITLWVSDEESGEPGMGRSAGMQAAVARVASGAIPRAELCIYVEPTGLAVYSAQIGFFIAEIELEGATAYFGRPEQGADALRAGHRVASELLELGERLAGRGEHPLLGRAGLLITRFTAGGYVAVPGDCRIELIGHVLPGQPLDVATRAVRDAVDRGVADSGVSARVEFPAGRDHADGGLPAETAGDLPGVRALLQATAEATGGSRLGGAPFWAEMSYLNSAGIPTVYWAPGDITDCHTPREHLDIDELVAASTALAAFLTRSPTTRLGG